MESFIFKIVFLNVFLCYQTPVFSVLSRSNIYYRINRPLRQAVTITSGQCLQILCQMCFGMQCNIDYFVVINVYINAHMRKQSRHNKLRCYVLKQIYTTIYQYILPIFIIYMHTIWINFYNALHKIAININRFTESYCITDNQWFQKLYKNHRRIYFSNKSIIRGKWRKHGDGKWKFCNLFMDTNFDHHPHHPQHRLIYYFIHPLHMNIKCFQCMFNVVTRV